MIVPCSLLIIVLCKISDSYASLESLVVFFRHGERTNDVETIYPKSPYANYTFPPYGIGELTDKGKHKSFLLGKQLRKKYNSYLDSINKSDIVLTTTEYKRAKDTLHMVLKGLFISHHVSNKNEWFNNLHVNLCSVKNGCVFPYKYCSRYRELYNNFEKSELGQEVLSKYAEYIPYVEEHTGMQQGHLYDLFRIYFCLESEMEWGLKLPEWVSNLPLDYFKSAALDFYRYSVTFPEFNRLYGGVLLKRILNDVDKTLTLGRKQLYIYSGHDQNIIGLLGAIKVYNAHFIPYAGCVILELHKITSNYYIQVLYQQKPSEGFKQLSIPNCGDFCPLESFKEIVQINIPSEDSAQCDSI